MTGCPGNFFPQKTASKRAFSTGIRTLFRHKPRIIEPGANLPADRSFSITVKSPDFAPNIIHSATLTLPRRLYIFNYGLLFIIIYINYNTLRIED